MREAVAAIRRRNTLSAVPLAIQKPAGQANNPAYRRLKCFFVLTKGMSLIGPRPERPAFCTEFEKHIHGWHYRTMVTPGLSGLAQVTGGYDLLPKEKVVLDLWRGVVPPAEPVEADAAALGQDLRTSTWLRSQPPFCWDWRTSQQ